MPSELNRPVVYLAKHARFSKQETRVRNPSGDHPSELYSMASPADRGPRRPFRLAYREDPPGREPQNDAAVALPYALHGAEPVEPPALSSHTNRLPCSRLSKPVEPSGRVAAMVSTRGWTIAMRIMWALDS